jgi:hypothetical protein
MSSTCKAVCAVDTTGVMKTMEVERRAPGPEDVDIDISFCGICHSDLHQVPQPSTLNPEPSAPAPNPAPCTLQTLHHAPCRLHPQPSTLNLPSAPSTLNPPTSAPNPQPRTPNPSTPQPRTPNPEPPTPQPRTPNPKSLNPNAAGGEGAVEEERESEATPNP